MRNFLRHLDAFGQGVLPGKESAHYQGLFDKIKEVRLLEPWDILDPDVQREVEAATGRVAPIGRYVLVPQARTGCPPTIQ